MVLPTGDEVVTVAESQWVRIPLHDPSLSLSRAEVRNVTSLCEYPTDGMHFFCETADITVPFPSPRPVTTPCTEFVWNDWLAKPFHALGLRHHCAVLLQGLAESRVLSDTNGRKWVLGLVSRRSCLHPGTRYLVRI